MPVEVFYSRYRGYGLILAHVAPGRVRLVGPFRAYELELEHALADLRYAKFERIA